MREGKKIRNKWLTIRKPEVKYEELARLCKKTICRQLSDHGHFGRGSGMAADFRYIDNDGNSFQNKRATTSDNFSDSFNEFVYNTAKKFGFTANGQGPNGKIKREI